VGFAENRVQIRFRIRFAGLVRGHLKQIAFILNAKILNACELIVNCLNLKENLSYKG